MNILIAEIILTGSPHFLRLNYYDMWSDIFVVYTALYWELLHSFYLSTKLSPNTVLALQWERKHDTVDGMMN